MWTQVKQGLRTAWEGHRASMKTLVYMKVTRRALMSSSSQLSQVPRQQHQQTLQETEPCVLVCWHVSGADLLSDSCLRDLWPAPERNLTECTNATQISNPQDQMITLLVMTSPTPFTTVGTN